MRSPLQRRIVLTEQSRAIIDDLNARLLAHEATIAAQAAKISRLEAEAEAAAEQERLRFEFELDGWMKAVGAGITGFQPEAYAVMDAACAELVKLRLDVKAARREIVQKTSLGESLQCLLNKQAEELIKLTDAAPIPDRYDAGLLSNHGGGDVVWWWDYIRTELDRAHDFYVSQWPVPQGNLQGSKP